MPGINSRDDFVARGYDVAQKHGNRFMHDLKEGHSTHFGMSRRNRALRKASKKGQKPGIASIGGTDRSAATVKRRNPSEIFAITCPGGLIHEGVPSSTLAAVNYAAKVLKIKNFQSFFSDSAPLLPYMLDQKGITGPHMQLWQEALWKEMVVSLKKRKDFQNVSLEEKFNLTATELAQRNADTIRTFIDKLGLSSEIAVIAASLDSKKGLVKFFDRPDPDEPYLEDSELKVVSYAGDHKNAPKRFGCSCCDSRALHSHVYCAKPGEYSELDVIAGFIPDQEKVLVSGNPSSAWLQLEMSKAEGCKEYVLTAHTKCGGIEGLMEWCRSGKKPDDLFLAAYLEQAQPIGDEVMKFARDHGFGDDSPESRAKVCRLAEMHVARVSGTRIKRYVGEDSQVLVNYLDIETQEAYALSLIKEGMTDAQSVRDTHRLVEEYRKGKLITLFGLYHAVVEPERAHVRGGHDDAFRRSMERKRACLARQQIS
jgi:carbonic anhydrase